MGKLQWTVLQAREAKQGVTHPDTVFARANLAATLRQRGQLHKAAELQRGVLTSRHQTLGVKHRETVRARAKLAVMGMHVLLDALNLSLRAAEARQQEHGAYRRSIE